MPPIPATARRISKEDLFRKPIVSAPVETKLLSDIDEWITAIVLRDYTNTVKNRLQKAVGPPLHYSVDDYTIPISGKAQRIHNLVKARPDLISTLPDSIRETTDKLSVAISFYNGSEYEKSDIIPFAYFHMALSKFEGATPVEKWTNMHDLFLRHFTHVA